MFTSFFFPEGACMSVLMQSLTNHLGSAWRFPYESGASRELFTTINIYSFCGGKESFSVCFLQSRAQVRQFWLLFYKDRFGRWSGNSLDLSPVMNLCGIMMDRTEGHPHGSFYRTTVLSTVYDTEVYRYFKGEQQRLINKVCSYKTRLHLVKESSWN